MKVFCILGDERVLRLKSPAIFSVVLRQQGLKASYVPFMVKPDRIGQAMQSIRVLNIAGANVTVPFKEVCVPFMDVLSEGANIIGAVNTIVRNGDTLKGYNTNAIGIMDSLSSAGFDVENKTALVFGTGGAARAAVFILNWLRTRLVYVTGRNRSETVEMVNRFGGEAIPLESLPDETVSANLIVNATSVSTAEEAPELSAQIQNLKIPNCEMILDLNYGRTPNMWEQLAKTRGIRFLDGLLPLAYQARRTFGLWTGVQVPPEAFITAMEENMQ